MKNQINFQTSIPRKIIFLREKAPEFNETETKVTKEEEGKCMPVRSRYGINSIPESEFNYLKQVELIKLELQFPTKKFNSTN